MPAFSLVYQVKRNAIGSIERDRGQSPPRFVREPPVGWCLGEEN